ncbi:hypothetical protein GBA65_21720 (plasmid) [Rubrobacter marinus]|uniref:Uncharacterized protein n=1 Tax=Rubrobacter marinus TaxID=2653852 RepID=A0A6G8Q3M6_9ACTN|nr:hypothetical protein [Rubrobacter marinus]QIN81059.1 hypothetical protein GBA65_21720 [Rubrobacter marinus]
MSLERSSAMVDAQRLAVLMRRLGRLEERERLLARLRQDHYRAEADLKRELMAPVSPPAETERRSSLLEEVRSLTDATAEGIEAELSDLEAERQELFSCLSEEGMQERLWIRNALNPRTGITLHGRNSSRKLWEAPWRAARDAPKNLSPPEVVGYAVYLGERLLIDLKRSMACLVVALVSPGGAHALAQSAPPASLGSLFAQYVLPLVASAAYLMLAVGLLVYLPVSLHGFCCPGVFMRRRLRERAKHVPDPGGRGDPSFHGGPRSGGAPRNDDLD